MLGKEHFMEIKKRASLIRKQFWPGDWLTENCKCEQIWWNKVCTKRKAERKYTKTCCILGQQFLWAVMKLTLYPICLCYAWSMEEQMYCILDWGFCCTFAEATAAQSANTGAMWFYPWGLMTMVKIIKIECSKLLCGEATACVIECRTTKWGDHKTGDLPFSAWWITQLISPQLVKKLHFSSPPPSLIPHKSSVCLVLTKTRPQVMWGTKSFM